MGTQLQEAGLAGGRAPGRASRLAGHASASRDESALFSPEVLWAAAGSLCTSWGSSSLDSWVLLIHRLSLDVTTPESFRFSFRLEAVSARPGAASSFSKRWRLLATPTGATKTSVRGAPRARMDCDLWMADWYLSSFSPSFTGSLTLALRVRVASELFVLGLILKEMVLGLERCRELL